MLREPGDGHVDDLAVLQRERAHRPLRRVRVRLQRGRGRPTPASRPAARAAASAPTKFGMRFAGFGNRATPGRSRSAHTCSRSTALAASTSAAPPASASWRRRPRRPRRLAMPSQPRLSQRPSPGSGRHHGSGGTRPSRMAVERRRARRAAGAARRGGRRRGGVRPVVAPDERARRWVLRGVRTWRGRAGPAGRPRLGRGRRAARRRTVTRRAAEHRPPSSWRHARGRAAPRRRRRRPGRRRATRAGLVHTRAARASGGSGARRRGRRAHAATSHPTCCSSTRRASTTRAAPGSPSTSAPSPASRPSASPSSRSSRDGPLPDARRGARTPLVLDGRCVGYWVCTRTGARPVVAHAGWRTTPETAAQTVVAASTEAARTPVPLQEARRVAREARDLAGAGQ